MAVPKKKMSNSKKNSRKATWKKKVLKQVLAAFSIGKSIFNGKNNNFIYEVDN